LRTALSSQHSGWSSVAVAAAASAVSTAVLHGGARNGPPGELEGVELRAQQLLKQKKLAEGPGPGG